MEQEKKLLLDKILSKTGDLNFRRRVVTILENLDIQKGEKVLDLGCGEGFYVMVVSTLYDCTIVGVDYDTKILDQAKKWLYDNPKVTLLNADIKALPFENDTFDKIICSEVLEHISEDSAAAKEIYRVLKPGGTVTITVPNKNYPLFWDPINKVRESLGLGHFSPLSGFWGGIWAYDHKRLYSPKQISDLIENAGINVEKLQVLTHYGVPFNHLILYTGKYFTTKLPVSESVKKSTEKFEWNNLSQSSLLSKIINVCFMVLKYVDSFNEKEFSLNTSTMAIFVKGTKK